jgi:hypothetical protein
MRYIRSDCDKRMNLKIFIALKENERETETGNIRGTGERI